MPKPNTTPHGDDADNDNLPTPCWDTSDTGRAAHLRALAEWLPRKHPRFKKLVEFGYIIDRQSVCCVSENHIDLSLQGAISKGSWLAPFIIDRDDFDANIAPRDADTGLKNHKVLPDQVEQADNELLVAILATIDDEEECKAYRLASQDSGRRLISLLVGENTKYLAADVGKYGTTNLLSTLPTIPNTTGV